MGIDHVFLFPPSRTARILICFPASMSESASTSSSSGTSPTPDPTESSAFRKWLRKAGLVTGLAGTREEQMAGLEEYKHTTCEKWKKELMTYSQY